MSSPEFNRFLEASRLTSVNSQAFVSRVQRWDPDPETLSIFDQSGADRPLPLIDDRLQSLFAGRHSQRSFNDHPITTTSLAHLLAAAGAHEGRPVVPSAGGLDPIGLYAVIRRGEGDLDGSVVRYLHREHRVAKVSDAPDDDTCRRLFGLDCDGTPAMFLIVVIDPAATLAKYGERGGRFLLQQVGHAMQNVGLRLAESQQRRTSLGRRSQRLHGYILGGVLDEVLSLLGLAHTRAVLAGGYAVGAD